MIEFEPEVGRAFTFVPAANLDASAGFGKVLRQRVTGTIVQVHAEHRWFRVAFPCGPTVGHECFKF